MSEEEIRKRIKDTEQFCLELGEPLNEEMCIEKYLLQQLDLYKSVIEEVREYAEELKPHWLGNDLVLKIIDDLLQILDKAKGENNG